MNYFSDEKDWQWLVENGFDWDTIIPLYYPSFPTEDGFNSKEEVLDFIKELLTQTGSWAGSAVLDRAAKLDINGAGRVVDGRAIPGEELQAFYNEATELQAFGLPIPTEYGGLGLPVGSLMVLLAQLARSCMSSCTQLAFYTSIADMVHRFCDEETSMRLIPQIMEGKLSGSMCLTEPGCGSDLGNIKTSATPQEDGTYLLNGSKIFITNGGGGLGFVLARIKGDKPGLEGISMFLCEQDLGDGTLNYKVAKNEEKMGMHGSFTCEIVYENSKASLIGKQGEGFKYMLHLMNEARIAVGMQALGGIEGSLSYAINYAKERVQFDRPLTDLPLMKRNIEDLETERDALRALMVDTISYFDIYQRLDMKKKKTGELNEEENRLFNDAWLWTRKRTPLVKYYTCEAYATISQKAIQILGGYGYMQEYPVERYHRDSFGPLLYEGTSQIQALMALKDIVKYAAKDPKKFFQTILAKHPSLNIISSENEAIKAFNTIQYRFKKNTVSLLVKCLRPESYGDIFNPKAWTAETNIEELMTHAETLTQALSYMETLRVLAIHARRDNSRAELFNRYARLVKPRLEAIYTDWELR
ncbi:acyl-CoA dehydrogenase family protein [Bacteriovorax sp. Seq25_V]|uniref:acyl-CoA dehydrogenase family protein n=1 Tax=Bacteriovorax sp. Seq25_V TaxID=1201288 RepID=UPI00038A54FE|nr:acyl-CoA dehydrogenase family protein [Bacteriovorax sp. Seq25_V]EQC44281.1 acyl-CoA dehydrogenase, C-terminal domain protein [Bacteriovorax sp. Seq25_V]